MEERKIKTSKTISIDNLRRKGPLCVVTAFKEEIFGLKGSSLVICRQKRAWLVDLERSAKADSQGSGGRKKTKQEG